MKRSLLFWFFLCAALLAVGWWQWPRNPEGNALRAREVATEGLAAHLAGQHIGRRVLIVSNPFTRGSGVSRDVVEMEEAGLRGLKRGLGTLPALGGVAFPS